VNRYKPYPKYKDSGVEWLGQVPEHWEIFQLKHSVDGCTNGIWGSEPDGINDIIVLRVADFDRDKYTIKTDKLTIRSISKKERENRLLKWGDLLIEKSGGGDKQLVGVVVHFDKNFEAVTSNFVAKMTPLSNFDSKFLTYAFAHLYAGRVNYMSIKQNTGIQNLDSSQYLSEYFSFPSKKEQTAIANFLDRETAKIDILIDKQRRLIELLKEKRQALISHAVTKGLDPNVKMKDSGVEWLGEVPEHWKIYRIGNLFREVAEYGKTDLPILRVSIHDGISDKEYSTEEMDRKVARSEDRSKYKCVEPGDLVYNMMRAWQGGFGTVKVDGLVSPAYIVARPIKPIDTIFVELLLRTKPATEEIRRYSRGITDFRLRLYWEEFKNLKIALPPEEEIDKILKYVTEQNSYVDTLIEKANQAITLLQERRTALISAAVTGKIDVREEMG